MSYKVVCFDLDGTLVVGTNSVRCLCTLNGRKSELEILEKKVLGKELHWVAGDHQKAKLFAGLSISEIEQNFDAHMPLIGGIHETVLALREKGAKLVLVSAGPVEVGAVVARRFGLDKVYGSIYEVQDGRYTGTVIRHLDEEGKLRCLREFCEEQDVRLDECAAVGDSISDVKVFECCKKAIAINYSELVLGKAHEYIEKTDMLTDILKFL